jgi:hypothetical protein
MPIAVQPAHAAARLHISGTTVVEANGHTTAANSPPTSQHHDQRRERLVTKEGSLDLKYYQVRAVGTPETSTTTTDTVALGADAGRDTVIPLPPVAYWSEVPGSLSR